jgi:hypothetical protein
MLRYQLPDKLSKAAKRMEDMMAVQSHVESATDSRNGPQVALGLNASSDGDGSAAPAGEHVTRSRVRFATTQALFETFPDLFKKIGGESTDQCPIGFLRRLVSQGKLDAAVAFCAYLLPRREAVWWACGCVRALLGDISQDETHGLLAAEAWVCDPNDERRRAALAIGSDGTSGDPITWLALAAGWSGGLLSAHPKAPRPMPPYLTAHAVRVAVLISAYRLNKDQRAARLRGCIAEAIKLAETGL